MRYNGQRAVKEGGLFADSIVMTSHDCGCPVSNLLTADAPSPRDRVPHHYTRYIDQPMDWRTRAVGMAGTIGVISLVLAGTLLTWRTVHPSALPPTLAVFDVAPPAAPPEPEVAVPEGPTQVEQVEQKPQEREERPEPPETLIPQSASVPISTPPPVEPIMRAEPIPETTAPRSTPAPPAKRAASNAEVTWEALLMTHLEKHRRYPAAARARREEGTVHVRFRMNRAGQVLWSRVERSSGSARLDRAALDTFRRAKPLPAIPDDKANELEFAMPVEFFVRR